MAITDPTDIANLTCWLDASQESFDDLDLVATFTDQHTTTNDWTQATEGNQPTFLDDQFPSGLPGVDFDGTDNWLGGPDLDVIMGPYQWSIFIALVVNSIGTDAADSLAYENDGIIVELNGNWGMHLRSSVPSFQSYGWSGSQVDTAAVTISTGAPGHVLHSRTSGFEGNIIGSVDGGTESSTSHADQAALGVGNIGSNYQTNYADITIGEMVVYDAVLNGTQVTDVNNYLIAKWFTVPSGAAVKDVIGLGVIPWAR